MSLTQHRQSPDITHDHIFCQDLQHVTPHSIIRRYFYSRPSCGVIHTDPPIAATENRKGKAEGKGRERNSNNPFPTIARQVLALKQTRAKQIRPHILVIHYFLIPPLPSLRTPSSSLSSPFSSALQAKSPLVLRNLTLTGLLAGPGLV